MYRQQIPADLQEKTVAQIVERGISVQDLKTGILSRLAQKLSDAKCDTGGCTQCHKMIAMVRARPLTPRPRSRMER